MPKIYFLSESFLSKYYQSVFGWKYLKKKGFNIKVINTAKLTYNEYFRSFKEKIIKNREPTTRSGRSWPRTPDGRHMVARRSPEGRDWAVKYGFYSPSVDQK